MTRDEAKAEIVRILGETGRIKATELVSRDEMLPVLCSQADLLEIFDELVAAGSILEHEYTGPDMPYRIKTIFSPV